MTKSFAIDFLITADKKKKLFSEKCMAILAEIEKQENIGVTQEAIKELDSKLSELRSEANQFMLKQAEAEIVLGFNQMVFESN